MTSRARISMAFAMSSSPTRARVLRHSEQGNVHKEAVFPGFGADDDVAIRQQMGDQLVVSESVGFGVGGIHINLRNAPFDDARVRKAIAACR